jgi:hypothetical protein
MTNRVVHSRALSRKDAEKQQAWDKHQEQVKGKAEQEEKHRLAAARKTPRYWGGVLSEQIDDLVMALNEVRSMVAKGFTTLARDRYFPSVVNAENKLCQRIESMKAALSLEQVQKAVADAHKRTTYASGDKAGAAMLTLLNGYIERSPADCRYLAKSETFARQ